MEVVMEYLSLNNGTKIATVGIGTFLLKPDEAEQSVKWALANGYDMIDTANAYVNERAVGRGIKASGRKREDIYLSTKLWPSVYARADEAIDETLKRLDTEYIDLLFLHQPAGDYIGAYQAMERAVKAGKVRSLGLSNFDDTNMDALKAVLETAEIVPAFVQVEAHPYFPQTELKKYLEPLGTKVMAWYPLGHGDNNLLKENTVLQLAEKYRKSPAQIILRWHTQVGNAVIPGSKNESHIEENIDIFDIALTDEELEMMKALDKKTRYYISTKEQLENYLQWTPDFEGQK